MKETIIKAVTAVVCVAIVCVTMSTAVSTCNEAALKTAEIVGPASSVGGNNNNNVSTDVVTPDTSTDAVTPDAGTDDTATPDAGTSDTATPDAGSNNTATPDAPSKAPAANNQQSAALTKADVIKFFNAETAKAAKGSYKLTRSGKFVKNINVGSATNAINSIIKGVDENSDLDSVVGGFLGIKKEPITGTVANGKGEGFDAKYMIKAMNLTDADVEKFSVNGNKYTIEVKACVNPTANSAMGHATNDFITFPEVNKSIANEVGNAIKVVENESNANYSKIVFTATVANGKITSLD